MFENVLYCRSFDNLKLGLGGILYFNHYNKEPPKPKFNC